MNASALIYDDLMYVARSNGPLVVAPCDRPNRHRLVPTARQIESRSRLQGKNVVYTHTHTLTVQYRRCQREPSGRKQAKIRPKRWLGMLAPSSVWADILNSISSIILRWLFLAADLSLSQLTASHSSMMPASPPPVLRDRLYLASFLFSLPLDSSNGP